MTKWWEDFARCVSAEDDEKIMRLLRKVSVTDTCDRDGNSLLHYVSRKNNKNIVSHLIAAGCDVNVKNFAGDPPLVEAISHSCDEIVKLLLVNGAILENTYFQNQSGPLHKAAACGDYNIFKMLLEAGCRMEADKDGNSLLHSATLNNSDEDDQRSRRELIESLLDMGLDVNARNKHQSTPLHFAGGFGSAEVVALLLAAGGQLEPMDQRGATALFWASVYGNCRAARRLLGAGAEVRRTDCRGSGPLHCAARNLRPEMVELLLESGAPVDAEDADGASPLWCCLRRCCLSYEASRLLFDECDDIIERDHSRQIDDQVKCMKLLLEYGANINFTCKIDKIPNPISPIYLALLVNHSKIVNLLLNYGATFDYEHKYGLIAMKRVGSQASKSIGQLIRHTAKYDAQYECRGSPNFKPKKLKKSLQSYYARCRDELELMKASWIYGSVSYFNILVDPDIGCYALNEQVAIAFETQSFVERFPIYADLLNERYSEELERRELIEASMKSLSHALRWSENWVHVVFSNIFRYLDKRDLRMLVQL